MTYPTPPTPARRPVTAWAHAAAVLSLALAVSGCGGGSDDGAAVSPDAADGSAAAAAVAEVALAADVQVQPTYHLAPVLPGEPSGVDRDWSSASARLAPRKTDIPAWQRAASTKALTYQDLADVASRQQAPGAGVAVSSLAAKATVTYTPAQIRAADGLPPVPSDLSGITALQAAQLGAGQTVYVIDAFHGPYAFGELLAFSSLFGLPPCTQRTLAATATLPLAAPNASKTACDFYQVPSGNAGSIASAAPRYDAQWAIEIAMDIQWAHAIAPLARIVLIEAAVDSMAGITNAIQLANRMGPGVVSMSFAAAEGSYVAANDALFQVRGMSYFASTGDNGMAVNWPAVSSSVVAVGGTSLNYSGTGTRTEAAWSLAGGGVSAYVAVPSYQSPALLRTAAVSRRSVADVSMNADPNTGQFVAVIPNPLTCTFCQVSWVTSGGTSIATPQWAGLAAVANAMRDLAGKGPLGAPHAMLYQALSSNSAYATAFLDVSKGANGNCPTCTAKAGYDGPTGLGTPNGMALINLLVETAAAPVAPTVNASTVNGAYGQPIRFTPSVSSPNAYSLSVSSAPAGMVVSGSTVSWPNPVAGTFSVKVSARDVKTGLSGQGITTVVVAPPPPPIVSSGSLTATTGKPLSFAVSAGDRYPCKLSLMGAPSGMTLSASGMNAATVTWPKPVAGVYRFTVKADNAQTAMSSQGSYTVAVSPASAPQVAAGQIAGSAGVPFTATVGVVAANAYTLALAGAPSGMTISPGGTLSWATPAAGSYSVTVQARDSKTGLTGTGVINVGIGGTSGPAIMGTVMTGVAGKAFTGTITITDASAGLVGVSFGASHPGIRFNTQPGMGTTVVNWAAPVAGNYTVQVSATDAAGKSAMTSIALVIGVK